MINRKKTQKRDTKRAKRANKSKKVCKSQIFALNIEKHEKGIMKRAKKSKKEQKSVQITNICS